MTDDIVARLRNETDDFRIFVLVLEAADEIERLRKDKAYYLRLWRELYDRLDLWGLVAKLEAEADKND